MIPSPGCGSRFSPVLVAATAQQAAVLQKSKKMFGLVWLSYSPERARMAAWMTPRDLTWNRDQPHAAAN
uniref:Uncharacterized protein n=1 Tax=Knipowitschia caucasica TaxID=637954 RepID=A0AAV2K7X6_KNICA